jgi:linoleoyl-CoA desaturase
MAGAAKHWRITHNVAHHKYTNILGMDDDVGYGVLRVTRDDPWKPRYALNIVINTVLALGFEWGIALQHLELRKIRHAETRADTIVRLREFTTKAGQQLARDYVVYPALTAASPWNSGKAGFVSTLKANLVANVIRNLWANAVIFCGHFPDGAEKFTLTDMVGEDAREKRGQWYLRQMLGSANIDAGPVLAFMTGNLSYQIEHHLYPDLPSRRLAEISVRVRALCRKYDLPYTSGPMPVQYAKTWRTIAKLSLPDRFLRDTADDAPETRSERMFDALGPGDRVRGLKSAITAVRARRRPSTLR